MWNFTTNALIDKIEVEEEDEDEDDGDGDGNIITTIYCLHCLRYCLNTLHTLFNVHKYTKKADNC